MHPELSYNLVLCSCVRREERRERCSVNKTYFALLITFSKK